MNENTPALGADVGTPTNPPPPTKSRVSRWIAGGLLSLLAAAFFVGRQILPFGIEMPGYTEGPGNQSVDPRAAVWIDGIGLGTKLARAELRDADGRVLASIEQQASFQPDIRLEFGKRYTLSASAERLWLGQQQSRDVSFTTVAMPVVESPLRQDLGADGTVRLEFSDAVGQLQLAGDLALDVKPDAQRQAFILASKPGQFLQGQTYTVEVNWETRTGVPLPPFKLEVSTAPPLGVSVASAGMRNLGLAMPVQIDFSEPLLARDAVTQHIQVSTEDGQPIPGKWLWYGKQRVQFRPQPLWPAESTIHVSIDPTGMRSLRGGFLPHPVEARFSTGPDKRIEVYLDKQRVNVIENGTVIRTMKASTGKSKTPTVTGSFYIYARFPTKTMKSTGKKPGDPGYYEVKDVPYAQYFYEGYAFHGAFWHNSFGQPASHGCVNLATRRNNRRTGVNEDAGWLYQWASLGVPVTVYKTSPQSHQLVTANEP